MTNLGLQAYTVVIADLLQPILSISGAGFFEDRWPLQVMVYELEPGIGVTVCCIPTWVALQGCLADGDYRNLFFEEEGYAVI